MWNSLLFTLLFASHQSKTLTGETVYNKITYEKVGNLELWKMSQSHNGLHAANWDQLAIEVDTINKTATFKHHQKNVDCLNCHANSPRLIRPDPKWSLSIKDKLLLYFWNKKITSYGVLKNNLSKPKLNYFNEKLTVKVCFDCHNEKAYKPQGFLTRYQSGSIEFLVKNNFMPPKGILLSTEDRKKILNFSKGL